MAVNEEVFLYAGDEAPRVKLTCIQQFAGVGDLQKFIGQVQDLYCVELVSCRTITDNLKIYGAINDPALPYYIVEYDDVVDNYYLWKTDGQWQLNKVIASFYDVSVGAECPKESFAVFEKSGFTRLHHNPKLVLDFVKSIEFQWTAKMVKLFWDNFDDLLKEKKLSKLNSSGSAGQINTKNKYIYKSLVVIAILKVRLTENKKVLGKELLEYHRSLVETANSKDMTPPGESNSQLSPQQISSPLLPEKAASPQPANENYVFQNNTKDEPPLNDQLVSNFNSYFKTITENYETYELKVNKTHCAL